MPPSIKPLVTPTSLNSSSNVNKNKASFSVPKKKVSITNSTSSGRSRESQRLRPTNRVSKAVNQSTALTKTNNDPNTVVEETTTTTTNMPTTSSYNPMDQTSMMGGYGGGMMSSPYGMGFGMGYNPYGSMMMMGGAAGLPFLSSLNQLLFGFQNVVFSLGQAMQILGMNTQALQQLYQNGMSMVDQVLKTLHDMNATTNLCINDTSEEEKQRKRKLKALRWTMVFSISYIGYKLIRKWLRQRRAIRDYHRNTNHRPSNISYNPQTTAITPYSSSTQYGGNYAGGGPTSPYYSNNYHNSYGMNMSPYGPNQNHYFNGSQSYYPNNQYSSYY